MTAESASDAKSIVVLFLYPLVVCLLHAAAAMVRFEVQDGGWEIESQATPDTG